MGAKQLGGGAAAPWLPKEPPLVIGRGTVQTDRQTDNRMQSLIKSARGRAPNNV